MKRALVGLVVALAAFGVWLATPRTYTVERARLIAASPAAVRAQIEDLHLMEVWAPRHRRIAGSSTFEGPASGVGAVWKWKTSDGDSDEIRITRVSPEDVTFEVSRVAGMTVGFQPEGAGTRVTWNHHVTLRGWKKLAPLVLSFEAAASPILDEELAGLAGVFQPPPLTGSPRTP